MPFGAGTGGDALRCGPPLHSTLLEGTRRPAVSHKVLVRGRAPGRPAGGNGRFPQSRAAGPRAAVHGRQGPPPRGSLRWREAAQSTTERACGAQGKELAAWKDWRCGGNVWGLAATRLCSMAACPARVRPPARGPARGGRARSWRPGPPLATLRPWHGTDGDARADRMFPLPAVRDSLGHAPRGQGSERGGDASGPSGCASRQPCGH